MSESTFTAQAKALINEKSLFACTCCGYNDFAMLEYDHIIPRSKGGSHDAENGQLLCHACNQKKGERVSEFSPCGPLTDTADIRKMRESRWESRGWKLTEQPAPSKRKKRKIHRT